ncbi:L-threonylcarbamoyladenylate synthase [Sphingorhabdus sp. Alg239-R122]|uniref:L-threonylcarbamoyladenylate synthase n=1 Tax=Sphingorhabdus sp. Alg239-R122 TaxID=2305989 RepID=UPI0013DC21E7|nr:L-threonylcarbamoyladenylate synthase [Sphingorhabdus sp. Alg239-R122]
MTVGSNPCNRSNIRNVDEDALVEAVHLLREAGLVALPTETVYGLAANARSADAVASIYTAKGRPSFNPLIVHAAHIDIAREVADFPPLAEKLAKNFWPGPLTLVLPLRRDARIAPAVTAGLATIAVRVPAHPVMQAVLGESRLILAAPSANRSGSISPTSARHVADSLGNTVSLILDGGSCETGLESTIVAVRDNGEWQILRPGPIDTARLEAVTGSEPVAVMADKIEAPGQLASHYAPSKKVRIDAAQTGPDEFHIGFGDIAGDYNLSDTASLAEAAARFYAALHLADASDKKTIAIAPVPDSGIGRAINDRLRRAAI